jgi:beta-glucosidase/6-phospho-beta-glucosidase/beta-galactosidase
MPPAMRYLRRFLGRRSQPLPPDFLFGVGTSDHRVEAFDPRWPDIWDTWEAQHSTASPGHAVFVPRGAATDFWNRYPEDVQLARSLGCNAFRFSVAWSRVEPEPGHFSDEALAHYRDLVETIRAAGMEPVVTLLHFVWPQHVEARGGLRAAEFPSWFEAYTARVRDALGEGVRYWITFNEPNGLVLGYLKPFWMQECAWPPGLPAGTDETESMRAAAEVIRNLFLANRAARLALRAGPGGERRLVSANGYYLGLPNRLWGLPIPLMRLVDWRASCMKSWAEEDWALVEGRIALRHPSVGGPLPPPRLRGVSGATLAAGPLTTLAVAAKKLAHLAGAAKTFAVLFSIMSANWWQLGMRGRLPDFLCPPECRGQLDFVAFDYYFGTQYLGLIGRLVDVLERHYDRAPIWPGGLYGALRHFQGMFPDKPLFVIENGFAGLPHRPDRARYLRDHIRQVQKARQDGVNVIGYLAWSLTTNREWGLLVGPSADFGLYHIDLDGDPALTRRPTPATEAYAAIIRHRGA